MSQGREPFRSIVVGTEAKEEDGRLDLSARRLDSNGLVLSLDSLEAAPIAKKGKHCRHVENALHCGDAAEIPVLRVEGHW